MKKLFTSIVIISICLVWVSAQTVSLTVNGSAADTVWHNEPVVLTLTLANFQAWDDVKNNRLVDERQAEIADSLRRGKLDRKQHDQRMADAEKYRRAVRRETFGAPGKPWAEQLVLLATREQTGVEIKLPFFRLHSGKHDDVLILDENAYVSMRYALLPEDLEKQPPGRYRFQIILPNGKKTPAARLQVRYENMPPAIAASEAMRLELGQFYLAAGRLERALSLAESILKTNPESVDALSLQGEIFIEQNKKTEALRSLRKALDIFQRTVSSYEEPEFLLQLIEIAEEME